MEKLQGKYEVMSSKQQKEDGEEMSQAYYVIKAAQEREELQRKGDDLDAKIRKAEKEVRALERSLEKLGTKNVDYAKSFKRVDDKRAYEERTSLRQKLDRAYDKLKFKRNEEKNIAGDVEVCSPPGGERDGRRASAFQRSPTGRSPLSLTARRPARCG